MILKYYGLGTCVFGYRKGFGKLEAVASLDAYQVTKYQVLQKLIFRCLIFEEIEKENFKSKIFLLMPRQHDQKVYSIFKTVPLGAPKPLIQMIP